jgi:hypothetical protein
MHITNSPHVDETLGQFHSIWIAGNCYFSITFASLPILTTGDSDHGTGYLADFGNFGASFSNDTTNQVIRHGHFDVLL